MCVCVCVCVTIGYRVLSAPDIAKAPAENLSYASASGDLNPIHTNPYFAVLAQLPDTITHGMWYVAFSPITKEYKHHEV